MANKGTYIYLDRGILDHWTYRDKPFNKSMAWIDLLLIADHTTHVSIWRGKPTVFKRGDVNLSITELAKRWGWSRDRARRFISTLEQDGMVRTERTSNRTVITLIKYEDFQNRRTPNKTASKTSKCTPVNTPVNTHLINNKEMQKEIKEKGADSLLDEAPAPEEDDDENYVQDPSTMWCTDEEWEAGEVIS